MEQSIFKLNGDVIFKIEKDVKNKVRLIAKDKGKELVCRKERISKILDYCKSEDVSIFKGRLQLTKANDKVKIIIKEEDKGSILLHEFEKAVSEL